MPRRVLLAGLFHETHTLLADRMGLGEFEIRRGAELLSAAGDGSPLAAMVEVGTRCGWELVPAIDLRASPGPTVADEVVDTFWQACDDTLSTQTRPFDGVCLVLHGAMVSESHLDVEGEILARLRQRVGPHVPICGVLDLHGNITPKMAANSQGLIAYRENPHADAHQAAHDGAVLLDRLMRTGEQPVTVWEQPPVVWPPTGTGTAFEPMRTLEALARDIERTHPNILAVNVFAGFSFADTPCTGVSFTAVTIGDPDEARGALRTLRAWSVEHRDNGNTQDEPLEAVLDRIAQMPAGNGPIVLAEPSDNIGGGAPGDGTAVLAALVVRKIENAAVAINDPQAVKALQSVAVGESITLEIGGRGSPLAGAPLRLEVRLLSRSDGRFTLEDPNSHLASMCGNTFEMGPSAVVTHGGVSILLTTNKTPPFDLGQWRSQGLIPETLSLIAVKAAVAHRRVYDRIASAHHTIHTPGPCSSNLREFPYRHIRRPVYPLD